jgi:metal-dependent hydrolase (beta-lactamase superfamily II)
VNEAQKTQTAKDLLKTAYAAATEAQKPVLAMALFLLGEGDYARTAAQGLADKTIKNATFGFRDRVYDDATLLHVGFQLRGCSHAEIAKIRQFAKAGGLPADVRCLQL